MIAALALLGSDGLVERAHVPRPDVLGECLKVHQCGAFVEEKFGQSAVSFAQIACSAGSHYVAAGVIAAAHAWLHVVNGQQCGRELFSAVHAAPLVSSKYLFAFHDGRIS